MVRSGRGWPLTGRAGELRTLAAAVGRAAPGVVVISGEAGIGKTRLLEELSVAAADHGATVTWIRGSPSVTDVPFAATSHLLPPESATGRAGLFTGAAQRLAALGPQPLLAVDDAHVLDGSSAALVRWLHEHAGADIAIAHRNSPLPAEIDQLERTAAATVRLDRLDRDATGELLAAALGAPVDGLTLERLWTATGGNPLFLRELVLSARAAGALRKRHGVWGWVKWAGTVSGLEDVVDRRLAMLGAPEREVVELVACGEPLALDLLESLVPDTAIAAAEEAGVLAVRDEHGTTRVRLIHPLFSECILRRLPNTQIRRHRRQLTRALAARGARDPDDLLRLADWALSAGLRIDPATFVAAATRAIDLVDLDLAERLARAATDGGGGWNAHQTLAETLRRQLRADEADAVLRAAAALSESQAQRSRSVVTTAENLYWSRTQPKAADEVLAAAVPAAGDLQLDALQAMLWLVEGRIADALERSAALLATARGDVRLWVLSTAAFSATAAGYPSRALEWADEGLATVETASESAWKEPQFRWARSQARLALGDLAGAEAETRDGYAAAIADDAAMRAGGFALVAGLVARQQGRLATAVRQLRDAVALLGDADPYRFVTLALAELGATLARQGQLADASASLDEADAQRGDAMGVVGGVVAHGRVWCHAWAARRDEAAVEALELARGLLAAGNRADAARTAHSASVLGAGQPAVGLLSALAAEMEGPWASLYAAEAAARTAGDADALAASAERYAALGAFGFAGTVATAAAERYGAVGRTGTAVLAIDRAREFIDHCDGAPATGPDLRGLTAREIQVVRLAGDGLSSRDIGAKLDISVRTVDNHLGRAYQKLGVHGRDELVELLHGPRFSRPRA